ncbi:MAG: hypothetical protein NUW02_00010 [Candidatus Campbellbacteria bacterium]|nr:hypothetical protein [Candidatus Campbellbacteria bacterium]
MKKLLFAVVLFITPLFVFAGTIERVSISDAGVEGNNTSDLTLSAHTTSSDGRYVAFSSIATNLVAGDTNAVSDVFVYDRTLNTIERMSVTDAGVEGNATSYGPSISDDGRYVAFASDATNLVAVDTNAVSDIFVYDRTLDTIERVSVTDAGVQGNSYSAESPTISSDGRYVAFDSDATNLVAGDTNVNTDIFVYDRDLNTIERVSVTDAGVEGNSASYYPGISPDGRYVAFASDATNLVAGDTGGFRDIFVYDRTLNTIERMSVTDAGVQGNAISQSNLGAPSISSDGQYVAFYSSATNLVVGDTNGQIDVFVYDRTLDTIERVSVTDAGEQVSNTSLNPFISSDGRYVVYSSNASTLVSGDTNSKRDIFVYDRTLNTVKRVNLSDAGVQGNNTSDHPSISADGRYVSFSSTATNFVTGDTNIKSDVFIVDRIPTLTVTTTVTNDNGGTLAVEDFPLFVDGVSITSGVATTTLVAGSYTVSETEDATYAATIGGDCAADGTITLSFGDTAECTIENDDIAPPTLTVTTTVTNDGQGSAGIGDFPLNLDGLTITSGMATTTTAGAHTLTHSTPADTTYDITWGGNCAEDGTLTTVLGETYTCTLTANDSASNTGSGKGTRISTPSTPPATPPISPTPQPLTFDEQTKLITDLQAQLLPLMRQLLLILLEQLAGM